MLETFICTSSSQYNMVGACPNFSGHVTSLNSSEVSLTQSTYIQAAPSYDLHAGQMSQRRASLPPPYRQQFIAKGRQTTLSLRDGLVTHFNASWKLEQVTSATVLQVSVRQMHISPNWFIDMNL
ncbi:hypothetical protein ABKN59_007956 [Abortiporus biennis]